MSISMSSASLPVLNSMLSNLSRLLHKAQEFVDNRKCDPHALTHYRLAPDMFPFTLQILIACDTAKNGAARLAGVEAPRYEDNEQTLDELQARIQKTLDFLATIPATSIDGSADKVIEFSAGGTHHVMRGEDYLMRWVLPNLYFHISAAYMILRHNGVELGKRDYLPRPAQ